MSSLPHSPQYNDYWDAEMRNLAFVGLFNGYMGILPTILDLEPSPDPERESARQTFLKSWDYFNAHFTPEVFSRTWLEILVSRNVDLFEYYLANILRATLVRYPSALSTTQITVGNVLEHEDLNKFIEQLAYD